jgi:MoxR-like ATPase
MFNSDVLRILATKHRQTFLDLHEIEQSLNTRFFDMKEPIEALILAVASGEPLLLIGKPGTAKSRLIRSFCGMVGLLDLDDLSQRKEAYFEYQLTPFTEPGELFGYYDIGRASKGQGLFREDEMMMQKAQVIYIDEVFNASSAILNTLLSFLNERYFHDRGKRIKVPMELLFAATNHVPDVPELQAIYDRFVLRCYVHNVSSNPESVAALLGIGWQETFGKQQTRFAVKADLLKQLGLLRQVIKQLTSSGDLVPKQMHLFYRVLAEKIEYARDNRLSEVSNRRLVKMIHIMLIHRLYEAVVKKELDKQDLIELGEPQLALFKRFFLDQDDEFLSEKLEGGPIVQYI